MSEIAIIDTVAVPSKAEGRSSVEIQSFAKIVGGDMGIVLLRIDIKLSSDHEDFSNEVSLSVFDTSRKEWRGVASHGDVPFVIRAMAEVASLDQQGLKAIAQRKGSERFIENLREPKAEEVAAFLVASVVDQVADVAASEGAAAALDHPEVKVLFDRASALAAGLFG